MSHSQTGIAPNTIDQQLLDAAAYWIVKLRSDECQRTDKQRFSRWVEADPRHAEAFDQLLDTWQASAHLNIEPEPRSGNSRFGWGGAIAAGLALLVASATLLWRGNIPNAPTLPTAELHSTERGEFKSLSLADGSALELNTNTRLSVQLGENLRQVKLLQGEAFFNIASDRQRPFQVDLGDAVVTVVGTAFNIRKTDTAAHILVTEGTVKVAENSEHSALPGAKTELVAGQKVSVYKRTGLGQVSNKHKPLHWRSQILVFDQLPLNEALAELNRYLKQPIELSTGELKAHRVSGTFSLDEPEATLTALLQTFELQTSINAQGQTTISSNAE
ncbi:MAG: FecR family protein [Cellvibrionaceae bacterium]|nr:FecR family protein [Cellvibrionaceae bacterium]